MKLINSNQFSATIFPAKISGIITNNKKHKIFDSIKTIQKFTKEIIVIVNESTDDNAEIANSLGAKIMLGNKLPQLEQKIQAELLCRNDWVMYLEAGEILSPALQDEIQYIFDSNNAGRYLAYSSKFLTANHIRIISHLFRPYAKKLILYNKNFISFKFSMEQRKAYILDVTKNEDFIGKIYDLNGAAFGI